MEEEYEEIVLNSAASVEQVSYATLYAYKNLYNQL